MRSPLKVAFLSFDFGEVCVRIASSLARNADILLLLPEQEVQNYRYMLSDSVKLHSFRRARLRQPIQQMAMAKNLIEAIRKFNPEVIHLQQGHSWFNFALPLLKDFPLVVTIHDPFRHVGDAAVRKTPQWIFDWGCLRADQVIVHAPQMKDVLIERLAIAGSRVHVVPHVLCGDNSVQCNVAEEDGLILFFGRIWGYKGLEYLIRAEPQITVKLPHARIMIAGTGEDLDRYRRMMVNPGRFIVYDEYVSDAKRAELFRRASVVVLPYIEATQSGVIPMAYSFGKPVVATEVGGLPSQVDHGRTGYLVPPRDPDALACALVKLLGDRQLRAQFGADGKRKNEIECSPDVIASQTLAVYNLAANGRHQRRRQGRQKNAESAPPVLMPSEPTRDDGIPPIWQR